MLCSLKNRFGKSCGKYSNGWSLATYFFQWLEVSAKKVPTIGSFFAESSNDWNFSEVEPPCINYFIC